MTHDETYPVEMFGQHDTISTEFYNRADKELLENVIKDNLLQKVKQENYTAISEPVTIVSEYLKQMEGWRVPVDTEAESELIVFKTTVKVIKKMPNVPEGYKQTATTVQEK